LMYLPQWFGKLKSGTVLTWVSSTSPLYDWGFDRFLRRLTIVLFLHRISQVTQCVCILTKALPHFNLPLRISYVELVRNMPCR
jgi:hypothetical protein